MLYPELFRQLESVRWDMDKDIPWQSFDATRLSDEQAQTIKMNAITEWAALPATEMFLRDNRHDSDFSASETEDFLEKMLVFSDAAVGITGRVGQTLFLETA